MKRLTWIIAQLVGVRKFAKSVGSQLQLSIYLVMLNQWRLNGCYAPFIAVMKSILRFLMELEDKPNVR